MKINFFVILLSILFLSCSNGDGGGGGGNGGKAEIVIKISQDCKGVTECIEVQIDGEAIGKNLKPGDEVRKEVEIGNHSIYAFGACNVYNEWTRKVVYVPAGGYEETLSCSQEDKGLLIVKFNQDCKDKIKSLLLYIDDIQMANIPFGQEWRGFLKVGTHKLFFISERNEEFGPFNIYLPKEGTTYEFDCPENKEALLTLGVDENCPCNFYFGITIYYTDPLSDETIIAGAINPGQQITFKATVGYHRISAKARCPQDNLDYYFGPEEVYLPPEGLTFIIPCNKFKP